jgi:hypothetical protein
VAARRYARGVQEVCRQYHVIFGGDGEWDVADQEVQAGNFEGTGAAIDRGEEEEEEEEGGASRLP